jgi:CheY-like chemotaxis protein
MQGDQPEIMDKGRRVLIVEDEALIAFLLEELVQELGYPVAAVANTLDTAMEVEPASFDIAILDVLLNGKPVYPFADTLVSRRTPFAFATGGGTIPEAYRGVLLLQKPFQQESLKRVLDQLTAV